MSSLGSFFVSVPIRQINGCRHYGPREEDKDFTPPRGSELFVARIPHDFPHNELLKIFHSAGQVYDVRLMLTLMKENKGFAFVKYLSPEMASKAMQRINSTKILHGGRQGHLVAMPSTDHRTLMLTGCPPDVTKEEVESVFQDIGDELENVTKEFTRGRASPVFYLLFASHRGAALMKKTNFKELIPESWGAWAELSWQPNNEVDQRNRFKLERTNFLSNMDEQFSLNKRNRIQSPHSNMAGFRRSVLSATNNAVQPQWSNGETSNAFGAISSFPRNVLSATNTAVQPQWSNGENSSLNAFEPISNFRRSALSAMNTAVQPQWSNGENSNPFEAISSFPGNALSATNTAVQPQWSNGENSNLSAFQPISSFPALSAANAAVQRPSASTLNNALWSSGENSSLSAFTPVSSNSAVDSHLQGFVPSSRYFMRHGRMFEMAQGVSNYTPLNPVSENIGQLQWNRENSSVKQEEFRGLPKPEGVWGAAALPALNQAGPSGNSLRQWFHDEALSSNQSTLLEPAGAYGGFPTLLQDDIADENSQTQMQEPLPYSLFGGRAIRGRGYQDNEAPKSMRF